MTTWTKVGTRHCHRTRRLLAHLTGRWLALSLGALLAGCAVTVENQPRNRPAATSATLDQSTPRPPGSSRAPRESAIAMSFSGGGLRAAAFALGALEGLATLPGSTESSPLLDDLSFITSVSGGSLLAAWVGLHGAGADARAEFRQRALLQVREPRHELRASLLNPWNLLRLAAGGLNDRSTFQKWLEDTVYEHATFSQMDAADRPRVWINATNLQQSMPFPFTARAFEALCSDLGSYPVAEAVAASMAVPLVFAPVVLEKFPQHCSQALPPWVDGARLASADSMLSRGLWAALQDFRDVGQGRYLKLVDGGLTDNFGLTSIQQSRLLAGAPYTPYSREEMMSLRRLLFIVVDGGNHPPVDWTRRADGPGGVALALASINAAIDTNVRLSYDSFLPMMRAWREEIVRWRCSLPELEQAHLREAHAGWACADLQFSITRIHFGDLGSGRADALHAVDTRLNLPIDQVDALLAGGRDAILGNEVVRAFVQPLRAP